MPSAALFAPVAVSAPVATTAARFVVNVPIGYLRAFVTVLVIMHHAVLAYHPFAPPVPTSLVAEPRWWLAFPIVDQQRSMGFSLLVGFNDTFFMSLMFFLSGLFVWNSIARKGAAPFVRSRMRRLGIPFAVSALLLAPLAYSATYVQMTTQPTVAGFWQQWMALGIWPAGPAWFVWLLLAFDCIAAALLTFVPRPTQMLPHLWLRLSNSSLAFFAALVTISLAVYLPMVLAFGSMAWTSFGPFTFQTSRILHYAFYFVAGIGVGAVALEKGVLRPGGPLSRHWFAWTLAALFAFGVAVAFIIAATTAPGAAVNWDAIGALPFALSCAASSCALLALFIRLARRSNAVADSLRDNAYGIYLVHYAFVAWLQYALLSADMSALAKGALVTGGALALSWATSASLRAIPIVRRVV